MRNKVLHVKLPQVIIIPFSINWKDPCIKIVIGVEKRGTRFYFILFFLWSRKKNFFFSYFKVSRL